MSARLNSEGVAAAAELGSAASEMFGGLNSALDFMTSLQEGKLPTREQIGAFVGTFGEMVGMVQGLAGRSADIAAAGATFHDNIAAGVGRLPNEATRK